MDDHLTSRNMTSLLLVTGIIILTTLSGCGCLSELNSSWSPEAVTTETMTEAYAQSGGTSVQSNQAIAASSTDESSVKVTDSGIFSLSDSIIKKTGETSSLDVWVALM